MAVATAKTSACVRDVTTAAKRIRDGIVDLKNAPLEFCLENPVFNQQLSDWVAGKIDREAFDAK